MRRYTSDDRNDKRRGFTPAERNGEGEPLGPSFEGVAVNESLSRRRMLGLAGGALAGAALAFAPGVGFNEAQADVPTTNQNEEIVRTKTPDGRDLLFLTGQTDTFFFEPMGNDSFKQEWLTFEVGPTWRRIDSVAPFAALGRIYNENKANDAGWVLTALNGLSTTIESSSVCFS